MKLLSSDIKKNIKEIVKNCKRPLSAGLVLITLMNAGSIYAYVNKKGDDNAKSNEIHQLSSNESNNDMNKVNLNKLSYVSGIKDNDIAYSYVPVMNDIKENVVLYNNDENIEELFSDDSEEEEEETEEEVNEEETEEETEEENNSTTIDEYDILIEKILRKYKEYYDKEKEHKRIYKLDFIRAIVADSMYGLSNEENNYFKDNKEEGITVDNFDTASIEERMAFICEKYNLTDFELKVIISVVFHEAGWYYDDAFKVATVIYNRTKSKESIRYNHYLTKLDGESMYSQVIATSYTKDGRKVQQFDGYLSNEAGYDFESILKNDTDLLKTNALLDCLILLKLGEEYDNPTFPLAPCFSCTSFWGDGYRNHFSNQIPADDVVDNYSFPSEEYNYEFTREDVINMAKEYVISAKKRVK